MASHSPQDDAPHDQQLFQSLRRAMRADDPFELLTLVSGLLEVTDPRSRDPFARDEEHPELANLVESFIETPYAETTAVLTVLASMVTDELLAARIRRELTTRKHPMPDWLAELEHAKVEPDVWFMTHVMGDGDDYVFGFTLPSGHAMTALVYVDHNMGTVVKDAFVVPESVEGLALKMGTLIDDPDQSLTRTDAANARASVEAAIENGIRFYPPLTSESWPVCRPVVGWMARMLPPGGTAPRAKEWTIEETEAIANEFFASSFGAPLDQADERGLLEAVLLFGTDYVTGDPLRWSPVTVEMLLVDWLPRKVMAEPAYLAKLPSLLRAYINYCHDHLGIRAKLTKETLAAVDAWEPEYQQLIRSDYDDYDLGGSETMVEGLERAVGGPMAMQNLDVRPLPDEPFEWAGIPDDIVTVVQEMLDACDGCADELFDVEHRTAMRRFLSRAAVGDPTPFRRKSSPVRGAAAVAWVIGRANGSVGGYGAGMPVQQLLDWFGVKGSASQRAEPLLRANGVDPHRLYGSMDLGTPDLLTSQRRAEIIEAHAYWMNE